jgi:hypothetical protein
MPPKQDRRDGALLLVRVAAAAKAHLPSGIADLAPSSAGEILPTYPGYRGWPRPLMPARSLSGDKR